MKKDILYVLKNLFFLKFRLFETTPAGLDFVRVTGYVRVAFNNRNLTILMAIAMMIITNRSVVGQDPQFSQFYSNPLYLAPSFAGLVEDSRIVMNYRQQWPEMPGGYNTYAVGFDHFFDAFNSGLGLFAMRDIAGSGNLSTTNLGLLYSFDFKINDYWHVRPGIHFSYTERGIDYQKLVWHDQISVAGTSPTSAEVIPIEKRANMDVATSVMAYSDMFWGGISVDHLLTPNQSFYYLETRRMDEGYVPLKFTVFGGTKFIRKGRLFRPLDTSMQLAFLYRQQDKYKQLDLGAYLYKKPIVVGVWYRGIPVVKPFLNHDAIVLLAGYKMDNLSIGYSYDLTVSKLINSTGGSHEISLAYHFNIRIQQKKPRMVPCPDF